METNKNTRTDKQHKRLDSFSSEIFVKCPHCNGKAKVLRNQEQDSLKESFVTKSKFRCDNCYKPINENNWYGPIFISALNKKCNFCGTTLTFKQKTDKYSDKIDIKCEGCNKVKRYDSSYELTYANNHQATEPNFGLQLWLQYSVDGNIFWAYNYEHLEYLQKYVSAKHREEGLVSKYSLTQKLPNFIKLAKNRERILKIIDRLQRIDFKPE
jgi:hypothetical protein